VEAAQQPAPASLPLLAYDAPPRGRAALRALPPGVAEALRRVQPRRAAAPTCLAESPAASPRRGGFTAFFAASDDGDGDDDDVADDEPPGRSASPAHGPSSHAAAAGDTDQRPRSTVASGGGGAPLTVRQLMRAGTFNGRSVEYRSRTGKVLLMGTVTAEGLIRCQPRAASEAAAAVGAKLVSCSEFEELAGSKDRRPGESIFLSNGTSLKDFCAAVNAGLGRAPQPARAPAAGVEARPAWQPTRPRAAQAPPPPPPPPPPPAASRPASGASKGGAERDSGKHKRLFTAPGGLQQGQHVAYITSQGETLVEGVVSGVGILCSCCNEVMSCSGLEAHAGRGNRRAPYDNIFTDDGRNLRRLAASLPGGGGGGGGGSSKKKGGGSSGGSWGGFRLKRKPEAAQEYAEAAAPGGRAAFVAPLAGRGRGPARAAAAAAAAEELAALATRSLELTADACAVCHERGTLLLCDGCPAAFHPACVGLRAGAPRRGWACAACAAGARRGATTDAAEGAAGATGGPLAGVVARCQRLLADLDTLAGGCVLCHCADFVRHVFGPRTMLLCDQCEREFHVGCLAAHGRGELTALPEGDWFCTGDCERIAARLATAVDAGPLPLPPGCAARAASAQGGVYSLQVLRGAPPDDVDAQEALDSVLEILSDSFDPILDVASGQDLLPLMVTAEVARDHDFGGMHALLLRRGGVPVSAAVFRVFGAGLAELPLIATASTARRAGHCAVLLAAAEALLGAWGVSRLALPAAHEVERMWTGTFGFAPMADEALRSARAELRLLVFPGARMLQKRLGRGAAGSEERPPTPGRG